MIALALHEFHRQQNARFIDLGEGEAVNNYGDPLAEHAWLCDAVGILDLSFRGRLCVSGQDRQTFVNGQVTNNVKDLRVGEGCYAALISARGKMQSDLNIYSLPNELLLDFEPGLGKAITERLEKYIIAADVQIVDAAAHYGLLSIQGPKSALLLSSLELGMATPGGRMELTSAKHPAYGQIYLMRLPRTKSDGFDLFAPTGSLDGLATQLLGAAAVLGGGVCGWQALEVVRVEAGIPRFGADMDESNLPPEAGLESRAISYTKGCYIGQEVIARIRTYGHPAKLLRGLRLADDLPSFPVRGDKLFRGDKEVGYVTSAVASPTFKANLALGYVRREANEIGAHLVLRTGGAESVATIVGLPFISSQGD